jgi:hypothetical protein
VRAPGSTVLLVVGADRDTDGVIRGLDRLPNVRATSLRADDAPTLGELLPTAQTTYVVHDQDPLEHVASAWVEFFDDQASHGTLDLEIDQAIDALRRGDTLLPDYYLVLEPESIEGTWRHWWLGVLPHIAPSRVLPIRADVGAARQQLRRLPAGRPWPEPERWLRDLRFTLPDRVGLLS